MADMDVLADLTLRDRALLVEDTLVLADLHVGRGDTGGLEVPVGDGADIIERFEALLERFGPSTVVVAGDLLHAFGTVPHTVADTVDGLAGAAAAADADLLVTPGNHDRLLDAVWDGPTPETHRVGDTVVCHGHEPPEAEADRYVVGHDHPTIAIEGRRRPCYLAGEGVYRGADLVMLPAFNRLLKGVEVNGMRAADFQSPLVEGVDALAPAVRDERADETLVFPPLGEFRHRL